MAVFEKLFFKLNPKSVIKRSQYFDSEWYSDKYGICKDPAGHYLNEGWQMGYDPSERFSSKDYLINNPDITGINPLLHYEVYGKYEGRRPFVPRRDHVNDFSVKGIGIPYEEYFEEIEEKKIISFDVFDTLVIRPFVKADELYLYLEKEYDLEGFSDARKTAESKARRALDKEVNIDEIYDQIADRYKDVKDQEIECEIRLCHVNPLILPLYERARLLNKKVIAVSDMYLPSDVVSQILERSGYKMDKIYVSCNFDKTKGSGELFRFVMKQEEVHPDEMIHFGDNYISDYSEARNLGICSYQTPKITDYILSQKKYRPYLDFYRLNDGLTSSIYLSQICEYLASIKNESFFEKIAYLLGGSLTLGYLNFVCKTARSKHIEELLFVSRDGYCLKQVYERYFREEFKIASSYAYLSRASIYSGALTNGVTSDLNKILPLAKLYLPGIEVHDSQEMNQEEYEKHKDELDLWSKEQSKHLGDHLRNIGSGHLNSATVDMFSGNYTSQKGAEYYLGDRIICGFYAGNFADSSLPHETYCKRLLGMRDNLPVKMSEFLITSPESPIIGIDENSGPIYEFPQNEEKAKRYEQIMRGINRYIDDYLRFFSFDERYLLSADEWINLSDSYLKGCSDDEIKELSCIIDSENPVSDKTDRTISELICAYRDIGY